jgi:signal transduction histidine kinase
MQKTNIEDVSFGAPRQFPLVIADMPITARERRIALGVITLLLIAIAIVGPWSTVSLPRVDLFIPVLQSVMCVVDLITAALLFGQYLIRSKFSLLALASGYVLSGLFALIQTLAFPGAYSASGLIGDGVNSAAWIFVFWHASFDLSVLVYILCKDAIDGSRALIDSSAITVGLTGACLFAVIGGLTWLATAGAGHLPTLYIGQAIQTRFASIMDALLWSLSAVVLSLLFFRRRTVLDLWLIVILLAWWPNFILPVFVTVIRFTLGWYVARIFALVSSSTLLLVLLGETAALYGRLANALLLLERERSDRLTSVEAATSAMAHEIRQPLTGISMMSSAALRWLGRVESLPELEKVRGCLNSIEGASGRVDQIIKSIRGMFNQEPSRTMFDVNEVIREVLTLIQHDLQLDEVSVRTELGYDLPKMTADRTQMHQVILNLVRNGIDAMRGVPPDKRYLVISTRFDGKSVVSLYVEDSGTGIDPKDLNNIFDPFFTTKSTGMGLGLSICRTIIESQGGSLRLATSNPSGSSFEVSLPVPSGQQANHI